MHITLAFWISLTRSSSLCSLATKRGMERKQVETIFSSMTASTQTNLNNQQSRRKCSLALFQAVWVSLHTWMGQHRETLQRSTSTPLTFCRHPLWSTHKKKFNAFLSNNNIIIWKTYSRQPKECVQFCPGLDWCSIRGRQCYCCCCCCWHSLCWSAKMVFQSFQLAPIWRSFGRQANKHHDRRRPPPMERGLAIGLTMLSMIWFLFCFPIHSNHANRMTSSGLAFQCLVAMNCKIYDVLVDGRAKFKVYTLVSSLFHGKLSGGEEIVVGFSNGGFGFGGGGCGHPIIQSNWIASISKQTRALQPRSYRASGLPPLVHSTKWLLFTCTRGQHKQNNKSKTTILNKNSKRFGA